MIAFNKPPKSINEHIELLKLRGMIISDSDFAYKKLSHITYYRLCSYWLPMEEDHETHRFKAGTTFERVVANYEFDRSLRLLLLSAIERIEISLRTSWVNVLKFEHGPHAHLRSEAFELLLDKSRKVIWSQYMGANKLLSDHNRSQEQYVHHFRQKYDESLPPIWAAVEQMSFGTFAKWFANTKGRQIRNKISRVYEIDEKLLVSFIHSLVPIRNLCAHHSRVWNRSFTKRWSKPNVAPDILKNSLIETEPADPRQPKPPFKLYNSLCFVVFLLFKIEANFNWRKQFLDLLMSYDINPSEMGFPESYQKLPIWQNK